MLPHYCRDVRAFHDKFDLVTPSSFTFLEPELRDFRASFFNEELEELYAATAVNDVAEAVDALIDLIYITCGAALLHGINEDMFTDMLSNTKGEYVVDPSGSEPKIVNKIPSILETIKRLIKINIDNYVEAHADHGRDGRSAGGVQEALAGIYYNCLAGYKELGFTAEQWTELWDDVQRANMTKERALKAADSKRGSKWDVIKPPGWLPPRTAELVQKFREAQR